MWTVMPVLLLQDNRRSQRSRSNPGNHTGWITHEYSLYSENIKRAAWKGVIKYTVKHQGVLNDFFFMYSEVKYTCIKFCFFVVVVCCFVYFPSENSFPKSLFLQINNYSIVKERLLLLGAISVKKNIFIKATLRKENTSVSVQSRMLLNEALHACANAFLKV